MPWFKVDDALHSHPKMRRCGLDALGLWTVAGSHCMAYMTDGYVEPWFVESWPLGGNLAARLVDVGLWDTHRDGGWTFHDWALYQPTKSQVDADRQKERERKAAWRESRKGIKESGTDGGSPTGTPVGTDTVSPDPGPYGCPPSPTRPDPTRPDPSSNGYLPTSVEKTSSPAAPAKLSYPAAFDEWWAAYPRKTGKGAAHKSWEKARRRIGDQPLLDAVVKYAKDPSLPDLEFIPHASTWLAGARWDDGPLPARKSSQSARDQSQDGWDQLRPGNQQPAIGA